MQDKEANELAKTMMSKKTKRLYGRMQHGIEKKQEAVDALERKRKEFEDASAASSGKSSKRRKGGK